ncbi:hypothetical protein DICPUDRAFT_74905 [Dictyostelium purpureum]|uniref:Uncharacterized protein n=1 Tax=Dictyostelium purpureum TaxID=5786 RepID=F0Z931_DICPU|nr:uncharacterized protein DICPUDRAFT_74905 [Dictyostelium purpureum]EGC39560.1 hypothetical protein DICPUDRAFT_74905 [Dictyostelium purpureum]|eukprot:XP_003283895.1 hypothetical protein DICPUDRAFT_74905 [Dictyostelium purpureum]
MIYRIEKKIKLNSSGNIENNSNNNKNKYSKNNDSNRHDNNIADLENLFWVIWRFHLIKKKIFSFIRSKSNYGVYKYNQIYSVPWMVNNSIGLLKDKVLNKGYLVFSDQLHYEEIKDKKEYGRTFKKKTIFNSITDDKEFYYNLFKNYKQFFLTNFEFTFNLLLKYDCLVGYLVFKELYSKKNSGVYCSEEVFHHNYSDLLVQSIIHSSFNMAEYFIKNYKTSISKRDLKSICANSSDSLIEKFKFILKYAPKSIFDKNLHSFFVNLKFHKLKLRMLLELCYIIVSLKELNEAYPVESLDSEVPIPSKEQVLTRGQLDGLVFSNEELETVVYEFPSDNLAIKSLLEMTVSFSGPQHQEQNSIFLVLKYTKIQIEDQALTKLIGTQEKGLEISKFAILSHYRKINPSSSLFKYTRNDKEKKLKFLKLYCKRFYNSSKEKNLSDQQIAQINQSIYHSLVFFDDFDLFDFFKVLLNSVVSIGKLFVLKSEKILYYYKNKYPQDYKLSVLEFINTEFSVFGEQTLELNAFQFILKNRIDFEAILSSNSGCRKLLEIVKKDDMELEQFKLFVLNTTNEFTFNLKSFFLQSFSEKYYATYFWIKETEHFNRATFLPNQLEDDLLLHYHLQKLEIPENSDQLCNNESLVLKIGQSTGEYNLSVLEFIIRKYYITPQPSSSVVVYKILDYSSRVGNLEPFKFIYDRFPFIYQGGHFIEYSKIFIRNAWLYGYPQLLDFLFNYLGLRKFHSCITETKYNEINRILFLNTYSKKTLFKN